MRTLSVFKLKGGAGATTIAANLAGEFVERGRRVAVLDADPQRSLLMWASLGSGVLSRIVEGVDGDAIEARLAELAKLVDVAVIDCPPGFTDPGLRAAMASDVVLLPCGPSPLDVIALREAVKLVRAMRRGRRPIIATVPSRVTPTGLGRDLAGALAAEGLPVLPGIRQRVAVAGSALKGEIAREFERCSPAVEEFAALAAAVEEIGG
jgi:chromosome partitioning protein